jgi:hypothetical protein
MITQSAVANGLENERLVDASASATPNEKTFAAGSALFLVSQHFTLGQSFSIEWLRVPSASICARLAVM